MVPDSRKLLLIASTGGHLTELLCLAPSLRASADSVWVTFRTPQSETLLRGRRVIYVPYVKPRDFAAVLRAMWSLSWQLREEGFEAAVSTGSAIALAAFPVALARRIPTVYIESLGRFHGPSTTGKVLERLRFTKLYTQTSGWAKGRWTHHTSVLASFRAVPRRVDTTPPRLFITVGTIEGFRFDALIDAVLRLGIADANTVWQIGSTVRAGLPGTVHEHMSTDEFRSAVRTADVVISHAGVGSLLVLLEEGKYPLLVTRRAHRNEHVDDHQVQLRELLDGLDIASVIDAPELSDSAISHARARSITSTLVISPRQEPFPVSTTEVVGLSTTGVVRLPSLDAPEALVNASEG